MSDDLLTRATAALRDETEDSEAGARFTRARVLASLNETRVKRRTRITFLLPLAACFAAATAWGTSGDNASRLLSFVTQAFQSEPAPAPHAKPAGPVSKRAAAPVAAVPAPAAAEPAVAPPIAPEPISEPVRVPEAPRAARAPSPSASAPARVADPAHDLYRAAHRAHFADHDPAKALGAWDAYLAAAPGGRFSLEARYNRALCLIRLGRHEEARSALAPFAAGSHGEYRRAEAQALLDGLGSAR